MKIKINLIKSSISSRAFFINSNFILSPPSTNFFVISVYRGGIGNLPLFFQSYSVIWNEHFEQ